MPLVTHVPRRSVLRRSRYVRTLPCESSLLARYSTEAVVPRRFAELPGRTVAGGSTASSSNGATPAVEFTAQFWDTAAALARAAASGGRVVGVAGNSIRRNTSLHAGATLAASRDGAATARSPTGGAVAAIR